jgi:GNAT superfamily N-acetyltransferase
MAGIDDIVLRPITAADERVLFAIYASTRESELAVVPWSEAQKSAFLYSQFQAQHRYYHEHYTNATFDLILIAGHTAGRLYVATGRDEIRIVDIALLPDFQNHGIGTRLIEELQAEAARSHKPLTIHVERFNLAMRLYERLGFTLADDLGVYLAFEWHGDRVPSQVQPQPAPDPSTPEIAVN